MGIQWSLVYCFFDSVDKQLLTLKNPNCQKSNLLKSQSFKFTLKRLSVVPICSHVALVVFFHSAEFVVEDSGGIVIRLVFLVRCHREGSICSSSTLHLKRRGIYSMPCMTFLGRLWSGYMKLFLQLEEMEANQIKLLHLSQGS